MAETTITPKAVISQIYLAARNRVAELKSSGVVRTVGRWNNQLETEQKEYAMILPAVWFELLAIPWDYANWINRRGPVTFRLHQCIQANVKDFEFEDWEFNQKVFEKMQGFEGEVFSAFVSINEQTNHKYGVWIDNMTDYRTFVDDQTLIALQKTGTISSITHTVELQDDGA